MSKKVFVGDRQSEKAYKEFMSEFEHMFLFGSRTSRVIKFKEYSNKIK